MHDGSLETLADVIEFYNRGGDNHVNKSTIIKELHLTKEEKDVLLSFLHALSGKSIPQADVPILPSYD